MTKARIAFMAEPPIEDHKAAIIVAVHTAREYLSLAERAADSSETISFSDVLEKIREFVMPPTTSVAKSVPFEASWQPGGPWRAR